MSTTTQLLNVCASCKNFTFTILLLMSPNIFRPTLLKQTFVWNYYYIYIKPLVTSKPVYVFLGCISLDADRTINQRSNDT